MKQRSELAILARDHNWAMGNLKYKEQSLNHLMNSPEALKLMQDAFEAERRFRDRVYDEQKQSILANL